MKYTRFILQNIVYNLYIFFMFLHYNSFQSSLAEPSVLSQHMYGSSSFLESEAAGAATEESN